jgi:uncharacterized protein
MSPCAAQTAGSTKAFQLLIKPAGADCNLDCEYCFYLEKEEMYEQKGKHRMSDEVCETLIEGMLSYRFPETIFAWQGGEPTLCGVDFFRRVVELEKQHGAPGQVVGNAVQTNGVLIDDDWCRLFRDYKFLIGLSIDGPADVHDLHRYNKSGKGMWERTMAAAERMRKHRVEFNVLCVVNRDNVHLGADLLKWFVKQGFPYVQFIPCVERDFPLNVPPDAYGDFLCDVFDYWSREGFGKVSVRDFEAILAARMGQPAGLCTYGDRCNQYIVVEHNGDVFPCDFFVEGDWKLGNIMEAPLHTFLEHEKHRQFAYQKTKVPACRGCEWRSMCNGGCQKDRLANGGSFSDPTVLCSSYKQFFAHAVPKMKPLIKRLRRA